MSVLTLRIDGQEVAVPEGSTLLQAAGLVVTSVGIGLALGGGLSFSLLQ